MKKTIIIVFLALALLAGCSDDSSTEEETSVSVETSAPEEKFKVGEYFSTGETPLKITRIEIYNSEDTQDKDAQEYVPGSSMLINLWCEDEPRNSSFSYIVPADTEHKSSYSSNEYKHKEDMFFYTPVGDGQYFYDLVLPEKITPGNYELRFVCGETEEGYFTFTVK